MISLYNQSTGNLASVEREAARPAEMEVTMGHADITEAARRSARKRQRCRVAIAAVALAGLFGTPTARADTLTWGLFQENLAPSADNYPGNCWSQAMIDGSAINGVLLQGQLTNDQAQAALTSAINSGVCKNQPDAGG